jgi:N-acetylmuramoyl-L-alanine amidase
MPLIRWLLLFAAAASGLLLLGAGAGATHSKPLLIFTRQATIPIDVFEVDGKEYVDLAAALFGTGLVSVETKEAEQRLRLGKTLIVLNNGADVAILGRNRFQLVAPFILQEGRGLVPLQSLPALLAQILDQRVDYHELSRRIFIGDSGTHLTAELKQSGTLQLSFSGRVSPQIAAEGGRLRLLFSRDGVTSALQNWSFQDPVISTAAYGETEAGPEVTITGTEPLLATFGDGGRSITITAAPKAAAAPALPAATQPAASAPPAATTPPASENGSAPAIPPTAPSTSAAPVTATAVHSRLLIVLDPAHGGDERGAALTGQLAEKDVTLAIARRLHTELENRGIPSFLLRDSDSTITLDQRATVANSLRGALYLAIHAGTLGRGVRIYTSMLTPTAPAQGLLPWETAQASFVGSSQRIATAMLEDMGKRALAFPIVLLPAPVRPLNNIAGAGVAVEIAPQGRNPDTLSDAGYQQAIAAALANAIVAAHPEASP